MTSNCKRTVIFCGILAVAATAPALLPTTVLPTPTPVAASAPDSNPTPFPRPSPTPTIPSGSIQAPAPPVEDTIPVIVVYGDGTAARAELARGLMFPVGIPPN